MSAEIISVRGAESMTAGYNRAMKSSDAKYKIYLHQDTFVVNKNLIEDLLKIFSEKEIGAVGMIDCNGRLVGRLANVRARVGYRVVVPNQTADFWCIHCPKEKPLDPKYRRYQKIFLREYSNELNLEV